jgi:hypothetical protein
MRLPLKPFNSKIPERLEKGWNFNVFVDTKQSGDQINRRAMGGQVM